jgi:hypothetical protein
LEQFFGSIEWGSMRSSLDRGDKWAKRSPIVAAATFANVLERTYGERSLPGDMDKVGHFCP